MKGCHQDGLDLLECVLSSHLPLKDPPSDLDPDLDLGPLWIARSTASGMALAETRPHPSAILRSLSISFCSLLDLQPLSILAPNLTYLDVGTSVKAIDNISPLASLTGLLGLKLRLHQPDISPLSALIR